jgi:hypothetical protein
VRSEQKNPLFVSELKNDAPLLIFIKDLLDSHVPPVDPKILSVLNYALEA